MLNPRDESVLRENVIVLIVVVPYTENKPKDPFHLIFSFSSSLD